MPSLLPRTLGVVFYLAGVFFFALNDALGKWLIADYGVGQLMMLRALGAACVMGPIALRLHASLTDFRQPGLQALRILFCAVDTFAFFLATRYLPLADVMTFYMAAPLIVTALSVPLLGERVEPFRWVAVSVGFVGVVIALKPTPALFSWASALSLAGAISFALGQIATRKLRQSHWLQLVFWQFIGAGVLGGLTVPWDWTTPNLRDLGLMFLVGIVSMACFGLLAKALALAPAARLAPLHYSAIVWATLLGFIVWRDTPSAPILIGNAIIILSGLYVAWAASRQSAKLGERA